ncbi:hypothetical protein RF11_00782 [Thelohanellus kitauei]|uniref:Uncharacterized protein n=1 Tax=Thelohanellus kitauei TaxID=669202 RepID=A0A0C2JRH1_THEKT|nr:hypothetical protein RF11_00782 [Thelohanellus kitauei]
MTFNDSKLIIKYKGKGKDQRLEITCKSVDSGNDILISDCHISVWDNTVNSMQNYSIGRNWILNKYTKYDFENLIINVDLDSTNGISFTFTIDKIYIQSDCYDRIFEIKHSQSKVYKADLSKIVYLNFSQYGNEDLSIAKTTCSKTNILYNKGFWILISVTFLLVAVIITIKLLILKKKSNNETIRERWAARSRESQ